MGAEFVGYEPNAQPLPTCISQDTWYMCGGPKDIEETKWLCINELGAVGYLHGGSQDTRPSTALGRPRGCVCSCNTATQPSSPAP